MQRCQRRAAGSHTRAAEEQEAEGPWPIRSAGEYIAHRAPSALALLQLLIWEILEFSTKKKAGNERPTHEQEMFPPSSFLLSRPSPPIVTGPITVSACLHLRYFPTSARRPASNSSLSLSLSLSPSLSLVVERAYRRVLAVTHGPLQCY